MVKAFAQRCALYGSTGKGILHAIPLAALLVIGKERHVMAELNQLARHVIRRRLRAAERLGREGLAIERHSAAVQHNVHRCVSFVYFGFGASCFSFSSALR